MKLKPIEPQTFEPTNLRIHERYITSVRRSFTILFFSIVLSVQAQNVPVLDWAKSFGGQQDGFSSMAIDASGNTYLTGRFFETTDFDPGPATFNLTSSYADDVFLMKLDADGNFVWARAWGAIQDVAVGRITIDLNNNIYVSGNFYGTIDFDPSAGVSEQTSQHSSDIFISKFDNDGNFLWVRTMGGLGQQSAGNVKTDASGNIYIGGSFVGTTDFDPGAGNAFLTSAGQRDGYVLKLDVNGNFLWAQKLGGTGYDDLASLYVDDSGNVFTTGNFQNTVDFDPGAGVVNITSTGDRNTFITKFDTNGNFVWAKGMTGSSVVQPVGVFNDPGGNVIIAGFFQDTPDFDPGAAVFNLTTQNYEDAFVAKLDANGNFLWAKQMGGGSIDRMSTMTVDTNGDIYTTGLFQGTSDFDPGNGVYNMTNVGGYDIYTSRLDNNGNFIWATQVRGPGGGWIQSSVGVDPNGDIYTIGSFGGSGDLDPGACSFMLNTGSTFIQKITKGTTGSTPQAEITLNGTTLTASAGDSYKWFLNGEEISGATEQTLEFNVLEYGVYKVEVGSVGCTATSDDFVYLITGTEYISDGLKVYPNPFSSSLIIESSSEKEMVITLIDAMGRKVHQQHSASFNALDASNLASGSYTLMLQTKDKKQFIRIIKK